MKNACVCFYLVTSVPLIDWHPANIREFRLFRSIKQVDLILGFQYGCLELSRNFVKIHDLIIFNGGPCNGGP